MEVEVAEGVGDRVHNNVIIHIMKNYLQRILNNVLGAGLLIGISLIAGVFFGKFYFSNSSVQRSDCVSKLTFLKPNIDCESLDSTADKLSSLQSKLEVMVQGLKKTGKTKRASVFVRDLNTSRFAGVDDTDVYYMASLLKTPLLIGGFKLAEVEPKILEQTITYNGVPNLYGEQVMKTEKPLIVGETYMVRDLLKRSIVYSDNTASQILFDFFPEGFLDRIMQALGIQHTRPDGEVENLTTARTYANIFRILYNASYLTKEYSNEALKILSEVSFDNGATSLLPKDLLVAHKFAERTLVYENGGVAIRQFHECGIVYTDNAPYIFCIMTEGDNYQILEKAVADISLTVYDEMIKD